MTTQAQHATGQAAPPPDVEAILAASRRLTTHADLLESTGRRLRLEAEQAPWVSPAASAAKALFAREMESVAAAARELRAAADDLRNYANLVAERIAAADAVMSSLARAATAPAGPMWGLS